jgi:hypothetical protein
MPPCETVRSELVLTKVNRYWWDGDRGLGIRGLMDEFVSDRTKRYSQIREEEMI